MINPERERRTMGTALTSLDGVLDRLERALFGKRDVLELVLAAWLARGHVLIEDVPGVGKTTLAHALAGALGLPWRRVQFTSDLLPGDVLGVSVFDRDAASFHFRPGPIFTSVLLADEINRAPPRTQSALLEAMEERQVTVDGDTHALDPDFLVLATRNPTDRDGAFALPASQLDRFLIGVEIGYPSAEAERRLLEQGDRRTALTHDVAAVPARVRCDWFAAVETIHAAPSIVEYVLRLVAATREGPSGLSPRAGLALLRLCRAHAFLAGRMHVLPADVQRCFPPVAGHRLTGAVASGQSAALTLLERVAAP